MVFFKLTNPEEGTWEKNKKDFIKDLKKIEERFRQIDEDLFAQNFISADAEKRNKAEENLKKLLASVTYERDMITKLQINHLSDMDKERMNEIEMTARKIALASDSAMSIAHEIGAMIWDVNYRAQMLDAPMGQVEAETNTKLAGVQDQAKKEEIFREAEAKKQQILANAMNSRESFAQGYVNQLLAMGRAELESKIREMALREINKEEQKEKEEN